MFFHFSNTGKEGLKGSGWFGKNAQREPREKGSMLRVITSCFQDINSNRGLECAVGLKPVRGFPRVEVLGCWGVELGVLAPAGAKIDGESVWGARNTLEV